MTWLSVVMAVGVVVTIVAVFVVLLERENERVRQHCEIPFNGSYCWADCEEQPKTVFGTPALGYCQQCYDIGDKKCSEVSQ